MPPVTATIATIEGTEAVLNLSDGQILRWPTDQLPMGAKAGDTITLQAMANGRTTEEQARAIVNELLNATEGQV